VPDALGRKVRNPLSLLSRWKIFDNLRRSLVEIATFVLLLAGWLLLPGSPRRWTLAVIVLLLIPVYLELFLSLLKIRSLKNFLGAAKESLEAFVVGQINVFFMLAFLSHQTLVMLDAIIRTLVRVTTTRRNLLEWETAAQAEVEVRKTPADLYLAWTPWLSLAIGVVVAVTRPVALPDAAPLLVLWACAGPLARWLNRPLHPSKEKLSPREETFLRGASLRTWRFFLSAPTESDHGLIPDNIEESPYAVAHRISPTNLGLQLNAQLAALKLGYLSLSEFVREVEKTLGAARRLRRFRGHFLNWYDTESLAALEPSFVSTVDSGNLACSLWTLKQGCLQAIQEPVLGPSARQGFTDHLNLLDELAAQSLPQSSVSRTLSRLSSQIELLPEGGNAWVGALPWVVQDLRDVLSLVEAPEGAAGVSPRMGRSAGATAELRWWTAQTIGRVEAVDEIIEQLLPWMLPNNRSLLNQVSQDGETPMPALRSLGAVLADLDTKLERISENLHADLTLRFAARALRRRLPGALVEAEKLQKRLLRIAEEAEQWVQEMDFSFLYSPARKLLTIGYDVSRRRADPSYYDLLASEARSAVFAAIAKGDIPQDCWVQLGRPQGLWNGEGLLLSWSGTMFEYLMPALWFDHRPRTILGESVRMAVKCQIDCAGKAAPWGISEAAFSTQDAAGHYHYKAFGLPFLALNPASSGDVVVAPYATFLALEVDSRRAVLNLDRLRDMGAFGELGFYDAIDLAPDRLSPQEEFKPVRCWMAHHQGMSLLAACNLLTDGAIHHLFHCEPAIRSTELLLDEKATHTTIERTHSAGSCAAVSAGGDDHDT
jgi:hypothetical protein